MEAMQSSGIVPYETCSTTLYVRHVFLASVMVYFNTDINTWKHIRAVCVALKWPAF